MKYPRRSLASAVWAMAVAAGLLTTTSLDMPVRLAATALVMGGNSNPQGADMQRQLGGYISTKPGTPYSGYDFTVVPWSAQIPMTGGSTGMTYDESQAEGLDAISTSIGRTYVRGEPLLVVGYSSSAAVVTKLLRQMQAERDRQAQDPSLDGDEPAPSPADLTVILIGNPNRPNGGVLARFPGVYIGPPLGATFDGATPQTEYSVTDISWQYDGISDFPNYPSNMLAVVNAMMGFLTLHGQYYGADPTDESLVLSDETVGHTRFITLRGDLPLLAPLYLLGVPRPLLAGLDAALRVEIERGYDRTISPEIATPAQLIRPIVTLPKVQTARVLASSADAADAADSRSATSQKGPTTTTETTTATSHADGDQATSADQPTAKSLTDPHATTPGTGATQTTPSVQKPSDVPATVGTPPSKAETPSTTAAA